MNSQLPNDKKTNTCLQSGNLIGVKCMLTIGHSGDLPHKCCLLIMYQLKIRISNISWPYDKAIPSYVYFHKLRHVNTKKQDIQ